MPLLAASSLEGLLIFVAIMLLSAISNWVKRRNEEKHPPSPAEPLPRMPRLPAPPPISAPPQPTSSSPRPLVDWEEELRRLLEGEQPAPTPASAPSGAPPPAPPRPVPVLATPPAPPPVPAPRPVLPAPPEDGLPVPTTSRVRFPAPSPALDAEPPPDFELATMEQSATAYQRAARLEVQTAQRLDQVVQRTEHAIPALPAARGPRYSPETTQLRAQLRHPRTARQVVLASVVLSPPKALEGL